MRVVKQRDSSGKRSGARRHVQGLYAGHGQPATYNNITTTVPTGHPAEKEAHNKQRMKSKKRGHNAGPATATRTTHGECAVWRRSRVHLATWRREKMHDAMSQETKTRSNDTERTNSTTTRTSTTMSETTNGEGGTRRSYETTTIGACLVHFSTDNSIAQRGTRVGTDQRQTWQGDDNEDAEQMQIVREP